MPETEIGELINAFLAEPFPAGTRRRWDGSVTATVQQFAAGQAILALDPVRRVDTAIEVLKRLGEAARTGASIDLHGRLKRLADRLVLGRLPTGGDRMARLVETAVEMRRIRLIPLTQLVRLAEEHVAREGLDERLAAALTRLMEGLKTYGCSAELWQRLVAVRQGQPLSREKALPPVSILPGDAWANTLSAELALLAAPQRAAWAELLSHCGTATASAPARKWLAGAAALVHAVGEESFAGIVSPVLLALGKPGTRTPGDREFDEPTLLDEAQTDLLRGLVWACSTLADDRLPAALGAAGAACFHKVVNHGPRDVKVGNACLQSLSLSRAPSAVAWLARLRLKIRHPSAMRQLDKALERVAQREGLSPQELEEISVPTFDLDEDGRRRAVLGDFTAELRIAGGGTVELAWTRADGTPQKSVPAAVRAEYAGELKDLQRAAKEIPALLATQRERLDRFCRTAREWRLADWRERYLDHPLVGSLARRLVWWFRAEGVARAGVWREGRMVDAAGEAFDPGVESHVALWHPLDVPAGEVAAWRRRLTELAITQPFKQAHREIYRLTDAERETGTYSNRFASQILKQHQLAALCAQRGWVYRLQGRWDSYNVPTLAMPGEDLQVELAVEPFAEEEVSPNFVYLYVVTDRVQFTAGGEPCALERVPTRAFSELMRDVDLFVGVCNAGNDPNWVDQARRREIVSWGRYTFGDLNATAATRREVLAGVLPKLKIAGACTLGDRFLTVRGSLRTYKIHLGSGNILMEPNDQYLCIVVTGSRGPQAFLPYEGDGMLDVILSKAFLLAGDAKITDPVIVRQIRG